MSQVEDWRSLISSGLKGDLVVLFRRNPGIMDTEQGVARRLGVGPNALEKETKELLEVGFLRKKKLGKHDVLYFDEKRDREIQESATNFLISKTKESETLR